MGGAGLLKSKSSEAEAAGPRSSAAAAEGGVTASGDGVAISAEKLPLPQLPEELSCDQFGCSAAPLAGHRLAGGPRGLS